MTAFARRCRTTLFASTSIGLLCGLHAEASAQDQSTATAAPTDTAKPSGEIVVTGSQIARRGYESPTPLTVVTPKDIQADAPTNIADYLGKLPALANSSSARKSATSVSDGNGGVSNLNLRTLGPNRTLVLLDGMRVAPSSVGGSNYNQGGAVDTNAFPDALISRVEVVSGGASAAYGSDAIAGAVNFVLDKDFTGVKGSAEGGITSYGDDGQYLISLTAGTPFADDRGHLLFSGTVNHVDGIDHGYRRSWLNQGYDQINNPAYAAGNGQPFYLITNQVGSGLYAPGGLITSGPLRGTAFGPGGSTRTFNFGDVSPGGATMVGGDWRDTVGALTDGSEGYTSSLDDRVNRKNFFGRASFKVSDGFELFAQAMYSDTRSSSYAYGSSESVTIKSGNPFIPASVQSEMTALGLSSFTLNVWNAEQGPVIVSNRRQLAQYVGGADGDLDLLGKSWSWKVVANRSVTTADLAAENEPIKANFQKAADVVTNPATGQPICASTLTDPTNGCVPYNPMGTGMNGASAMAYATGGTAWLHQSIYQNDFTGTLRGEPFSTWAGPVSLATGVEYRTLRVKGNTDALDAANSFFSGNFHATNGSYNVTEGFLETVVPLARDVSWARAIDLNAAVRETHYSTSGSVTTWKVGGTYDTPIAGLRLRATRSRDIRAPNLGELYSGGQSTQGNLNDPTKGNQAVTNVVTVTSGNTDLKPEVADNLGFGAVYQPAWLPGFTASVDYYNVHINKAIAQIAAQDVVDGCYEGVQLYCGYVTRDAGGNITLVRSTYVNTAYVRSRGIDIDLSYQKDLSSVSDKLRGRLSLHGLVTHVMNLTTIAPNGVVTENAGANTASSASGAGAPSWRYNVDIAYDTDAYSISWTGRGFSAGKLSSLYTECLSDCPVLTAPYYTINDNHMPGAFYMDMSFTYHIRQLGLKDADAFVTVENIANKGPNFYVAVQNGLYDKIGRVFRFGIRFRV